LLKHKHWLFSTDNSTQIINTYTHTQQTTQKKTLPNRLWAS